MSAPNKKQSVFIVLISAIIIALLFIPIKNSEQSFSGLNVTATNFPGYDFAKSIAKDTGANIKMLIKPGTDTHHYDPTPQDIIRIKESDIFIYNGGESEEWIERILSEIDINKTKVVRMMDGITLINEASEGNEYDEHVWASPNNALIIAENIYSAMQNIDKENKNHYQQNFETLKNDIKELKDAYLTLKQQKGEELIIADRFPFIYLFSDYNLRYFALFPGCSEETEPSAKNVTTMLKKVDKNSKKYVFYLKNSNTNFTQNADLEPLYLYSMDNIGQEDFDSGKTYIDFMNINLSNIKKAI